MRKLKLILFTTFAVMLRASYVDAQTATTTAVQSKIQVDPEKIRAHVKSSRAL